MNPVPIRIGIINVSDRASAGIYEDLPGKEARRLLDAYLSCEWTCSYAVIPDEQAVIEQTLRRMADEEGCSLILTTGGTGPAPRDVTPDATVAVCDKLLPGFGEAMRMQNFQRIPTTILSRQTAGYRGCCLIVNLPGKPRAIEECLQVVFPAIPYAVELIGGGSLQVNPEVIGAFRPKTD
jgi:molybdopterin adenylyltransferase